MKTIQDLKKNPDTKPKIIIAIVVILWIAFLAFILVGCTASKKPQYPKAWGEHWKTHAYKEK